MQIRSATLTNAKPSNVKSVNVPPDAFHKHKNLARRKEAPPQPQEKIDPRLAQWIDERPGEHREQVIITFDDDYEIPRFPELIAQKDQADLDKYEELINSIIAHRASGYSALEADLKALGAIVLGRFWLGKSIFAEMPLSQLKALSVRDDVLSIEARYGDPLVVSAVRHAGPNDVAAGRRRIGSDPYFELGFGGGIAALLDTGVSTSHRLLAASGRGGFMGDCVGGGQHCDSKSATFDAGDVEKLSHGHGTKSAAILTGNDSKGSNSRGVTAATLLSFRVYFAPSTPENPMPTARLDSVAAYVAFQRAIAMGARVILAEIQHTVHRATSCMSKAADRAFDAGAVVIAANGNFGNGGANPRSVNGPALAHKVIGVGSFNVANGTQDPDQSLGPAPDGRIKPDIQAPTGVQTADTRSDTDLGEHSGTSGAAPFAAGAAILLRNFLLSTGDSAEPGQVYALLILSGQGPFPPNNTTGAGPLHLPNTGLLRWGKLELPTGEDCRIPIEVSGITANTFDGALWWPENARAPHNDIELHIVDPDGRPRASSALALSVFQRARFRGTVANGEWKLHIRCDREAGVQTVYWAAFVHLATTDAK